MYLYHLQRARASLCARWPVCSHLGTSWPVWHSACSTRPSTSATRAGRSTHGAGRLSRGAGPCAAPGRSQLRPLQPGDRTGLARSTRRVYRETGHGECVRRFRGRSQGEVGVERCEFAVEEARGSEEGGRGCSSPTLRVIEVGRERYGAASKSLLTAQGRGRYQIMEFCRGRHEGLACRAREFATGG